MEARRSELEDAFRHALSHYERLPIEQSIAESLGGANNKHEKK
jgi:hypothetical protein